MGNPLVGASLKVVRAQQHLDAIKDFIARYCGSDPHTISVQKNDGVIETSFGIQDPDAFLSTIIGDCLTNCRASLDYTIWQLAEKFFSRTLFGPPAGKDRVHFPICDDPKNFETRKKDASTNYQISADAIKVVYDLQPHGGGYQPLWLLHLLVNIDKHRLPIVTFGQMGAAEFSIDLGQPKISATFPANPHKAALTPTDVNMYVQGQAAVYVAWGYEFMPDGPVERALEDIVKTVANGIQRFEGFFA